VDTPLPNTLVIQIELDLTLLAQSQLVGLFEHADGVNTPMGHHHHLLLVLDDFLRVGDAVSKSFSINSSIFKRKSFSAYLKASAQSLDSMKCLNS
jgi:hypothetical protein